MLFDIANAIAFIQDTPPKAADPKPATPPIDVAKAATELVSDPTHTVSRWVEVGWRMLQEHGPSLLGAGIMLFFSYVLAKWVRRIIINGCMRAKIDITLAKFFGNLAKWAIVIFAFVSAAGTVGISTAGFAAMIGAAGLAIGLALQGNLGNMAAGVLLLIFRPFKVGDSVIVAGQAGVIDGIDLFTTNVDTGDNRRVIVPNGAIFGGVIENQSHHPRRRVDYTIALAAGGEIDRVRSILAGVVQTVLGADVGAINDPGNAITLSEITPNQLWTINLWAQTPRAGAVRERLLIELRHTIDRERLAPPAPVQLVKQVT